MDYTVQTFFSQKVLKFGQYIEHFNVCLKATGSKSPAERRAGEYSLTKNELNSRHLMAGRNAGPTRSL